MFQVVFASWPAPCWLLVLNVSEWYGVFFILYRCVLGFSLVKVVTSMFIQETHRICQKDQEIAKAKTKCDSETHKKQLLDLFVEHDESGDGTISWQEFQHLMANPRLIKWTERMGISHLLLEELFGVLQKTGRGDNEHERYVDLESFVSGAVKVGGAARSIDILAVLTAMDEIQGKLPTYDMRVEKPFQSFLDEQVTRMPSRPPVTDEGRPRSPRRPPFSLAEWAPA